MDFTDTKSREIDSSLSVYSYRYNEAIQARKRALLTKFDVATGPLNQISYNTVTSNRARKSTEKKSSHQIQDRRNKLVDFLELYTVATQISEGLKAESPSNLLRIETMAKPSFKAMLLSNYDLYEEHKLTFGLLFKASLRGQTHLLCKVYTPGTAGMELRDGEIWTPGKLSISQIQEIESLEPYLDLYRIIRDMRFLSEGANSNVLEYLWVFKKGIDTQDPTVMAYVRLAKDAAENGLEY